jgi:hypothetical protein
MFMEDIVSNPLLRPSRALGAFAMGAAGGQDQLLIDMPTIVAQVFAPARSPLLRNVGGGFGVDRSG